MGFARIPDSLWDFTGRFLVESLLILQRVCFFSYANSIAASFFIQPIRPSPRKFGWRLILMESFLVRIFGERGAIGYRAVGSGVYQGSLVIFGCNFCTYCGLLFSTIGATQPGATTESNRSAPGATSPMLFSNRASSPIVPPETYSTWPSSNSVFWPLPP